MITPKKGPGHSRTVVTKAPPEEFYTPGSSNVAGATFYPDHKLVRVRFKRAGGMLDVYEYYPVSREEWEAFKVAPSIGKYVNAYLRPKEPRKVA